MKFDILSVDEIKEPSYDVRSWISQEKLDEMAESIKAVGILKPLRVFRVDGKYEIEDGHRRFLAGKMVGINHFPCVIVDSLEGVRELKKLHANIHSEGLSPVEKSKVLNDVQKEYKYTVQELADLMGLSVSRISQLLGLVKLDPNLVQAMEDKLISEAHARLLQQVPDPERRVYYIHYIKDGGATVAMVQSWVAQERVWADQPSPPPELLEETPPHAPIEYPQSPCTCCRKFHRKDALLILRVCGDCFNQLNEILPSIYKAMMMDQQGAKNKTEDTPSSGNPFGNVIWC